MYDLKVYKHPEPYKVIDGGNPARYGWVARRSKSLFVFLDDKNQLVYGLQSGMIDVLYPPPNYTYETAVLSVITEEAESYIESSWFEVVILTGFGKEHIEAMLQEEEMQKKIKDLKHRRIKAAEDTARIKRKVNELRDAGGIPTVYEDVDGCN